MKSTLEAILIRELNRLDAASKEGPLDFEAVKKLESLTRSLKQLEDPQKKDTSLADITYEELLMLAKAEAPNGRNIEPRPSLEGKEASRPKKGRRRTVANREDS